MTDRSASASKLAAQVLVGLLEWPRGCPGGRVGASRREGRVSGRLVAPRVTGRRVDAVGERGVGMVWTVSGLDALAAVAEDARGMAGVLGTSGVVEVSRTRDVGGSWKVWGTMPWRAGRRGMGWEDAVELLREEGLA